MIIEDYVVTGVGEPEPGAETFYREPEPELVKKFREPKPLNLI